MSARGRNPFVCFAVGLPLLLSMTRALAQTDNATPVNLSPPSSVVDVARKIANDLESNIKGDNGFKPIKEMSSREPDFVYLEKDRETGHSLWKMIWRVSENGESNDFWFTVDEESEKVIGFSDHRAQAAARADFKAGKPVAVTESQAKAALESVMQVINVLPGDWQDEPAELRQYAGVNGAPGEYYWKVIKRRLVGGLSVGRGMLFVIVDAYGGRITCWNYVDSAIQVLPSRPLFPPEQLEPSAIRAFEEYTAPILKPGDSHKPSHSPKRPHWRRMDDDSPLCRLQYVFSFDLSFIDDPTFEERHQKDSNDNNWYGRGEQTIWGEMDAETGEILAVWTPSGGGGANRPYSGYSARVGMLYPMLKIKPADALALAVIGGFPLKNPAPPDPKDTSVVRLHRTIGAKTYYFAFAPKAKRLLWQTGGGERPAGWAGVSLSDEHAAALSRLLKGQPTPPVKPASAAKTKQSKGTLVTRPAKPAPI